MWFFHVRRDAVSEMKGLVPVEAVLLVLVQRHKLVECAAQEDRPLMSMSLFTDRKHSSSECRKAFMTACYLAMNLASCS